MSDPRTKAERSAAKDIRQGVAAQRERAQVDKKRKRAPRPWLLVWRSGVMLRSKRWPDGMVWGRYHTEGEALHAADRQARKLSGSWTVKEKTVA